MIQVENISKKYGKHTAVENLSFTVEKGRIYGFLGPNGAGKSTTMNIMTGYIAASSGTVKINGFDILEDAKKAKKCIGYLPEIPPLYTDMTVQEYLLFAAELKKVPRKERPGHIEEIIGRTQLTGVEGRLIRNLSKGYKQRVGLAQALVGYPEVLILDEPMAGLDPKQILEMRGLIKELAEEHTILLSSHILSEVSAVCDHIMIISKGKLAASGSPEELQEMMQVKTELEVTVLGEKEQAEEVLKEIGQIESYELAAGTEAGSIKLRLDIADNSDIRKELSVALAGAGIPILSMNRLEKSLEDIFLELTEDPVDTECEEADEDPGDEDTEYDAAEDEYAEDVDVEKMVLEDGDTEQKASEFEGAEQTDSADGVIEQAKSKDKDAEQEDSAAEVIEQAKSKDKDTGQEDSDGVTIEQTDSSTEDTGHETSKKRHIKHRTERKIDTETGKEGADNDSDL